MIPYVLLYEKKVLYPAVISRYCAIFNCTTAMDVDGR
jgi:hypothetical protein